MVFLIKQKIKIQMQDTTILSNLLSFIPRHKFNRFVNKYSGDKYSKNFKMHDHFASMLYGVITSSNSLRCIEAGFNSHNESFLHLKTRSVSKSTLSDINNRDKSRKIYEEVLDYIINLCLSNNKLSKTDYQSTNKLVNIIDSTEIKLNANSQKYYPSKHRGNQSHMKVHVVTDYANSMPKDIKFTRHNINDITVAKRLFKIETNQIYVFDKGYYDFKWWSDIDKANSIFVTRLKKNSPRNNIKILNESFSDTNIISDKSINLSKRLKHSRNHPYKKRLREVVVKGENNKILYLVTNDMISDPEQIAKLYKARWSIELFFKWIKQNLKIKKFYGYSQNAIKIQIMIAIIAYLLIKMLKQNIDNKKSFIQFFYICRANIMKKIHNIYILFYQNNNSNYYNYLLQKKNNKIYQQNYKQLKFIFSGQ